MNAILVAAVIVGMAASASCEVYGICQLAKEMKKEGVPTDQIPNWVCLSKAVSGLDSSKVVGPDKAGNYFYGLFQIPSNGWCMKGKAGNQCNVKCEDIVKGDVSVGISCARKIYSAKGFEFWSGWLQSCKGRPLPDIHDC